MTKLEAGQEFLRLAFCWQNERLQERHRAGLSAVGLGNGDAIGINQNENSG